MAGFQPYNFNFGLDPALLSQSPSSMGSSMLQMGGYQPPSAVADAGEAVVPGNLFSRLFGDSGGGGFFSGDGVFSKNSMFGGTDTATGIVTKGWAPVALGLGQAFLGARQGREALSLARDQFDESRRQFDLNFNTQRQTLNTAMEDRQRARVASNPGAYESVDDYMNKNRV